MLVGILSDTHDRVDATSAAVRLLCEAGAEYFLHCGDLGSRRALDPFKGLAAGFVWGDTDRDRMGLLRHADALQVQCFGVLGDFLLEDKRIAITHGDDAKLIKKLVREGQHDFLLHGHISKLRDDRDGPGGKTRIITPGVIFGAPRRTAVLLDTQSGALRVFDVPTSS